MAGFSTEAKVGVFMVAALAMLAYMTITLGEFTVGREAGYEVRAEFADVTGLKEGAPVEVAGIQIGKVGSIKLAEGKALVTLLIRPEVKLPLDSRLTVRTKGMLGDKFIQVEPGPDRGPYLSDGATARNVGPPAGLDEVIARLGPIAEDVKAITGALKSSLASQASQQNISEILANLKDVTAALKDVAASQANRDNFEKTLGNARELSESLKQIVADNRRGLERIVANLDKSTQALNMVIAKINKGEGTLGALVNERETVDALNQTLSSLREVSYKIKSGEGTVGRLVTDSSTADKLDQALDGVNSLLTKADSLHMFVDWRGEYFSNENSWRSELNLRIQPKADKFYLLGVIYEPLGRRTRTVTETTYTLGGSTWTLTEDETRFGRTEVTFNAQIGKRFRDLALRGGLLSSTGGFGVDYYLYDDRLKLTGEMFDFREEERPRLRFAADYSFFKNFFITAGVDNVLSEYDETNFFLGAGMSFQDDDLKLLLGSVPIPGL